MEFWTASLLALIAGLATGIGGLAVLLPVAKKEKFLNFSLAFSGGVMLLISFLEIFPKSVAHLEHVSSSFKLTALMSLFLGMAIFYFMNLFFKNEDSIKKLSILIPLVIIGHNIPEGLLTFLSALKDPQFGIKIATAVAFHNIPEGLAVALPIYLATQSKLKAIAWAFFSGIMETFGAILGYFILKPFLNDWLYGVLFALIAGIMIIVALVEMIPLSFQKEPRIAQIGLIGGFLVMGIGLGVLF
jgi:ZIP family zinc transporter